MDSPLPAMSVTKYIEQLLWLVAPENCRHCRSKYALADFIFCADCSEKIYYFDKQNRCHRCGTLLNLGNCPFCSSRQVFFSGCDFLFRYDGAGRTLLKAAKFHESYKALRYIARNLSVPASLKRETILLPLPSSKKLTNFAAKLLSEQSQARIEYDVFYTDSKRNTKTLGKQERLVQLQKLQLKSDKIRFSGAENIVLVDDIFTSGATLNRAARLLHEFGDIPCDKIFIFALFRRDSLQ